MGTICAPLLAALFLYLYEAYFIHGFLKKNEKKLSRSFNVTFRYKDDVLSLCKRFADYVDRVYPVELGIEHTTDAVMSASFFDTVFTELRYVQVVFMFLVSCCDVREDGNVAKSMNTN